MTEQIRDIHALMASGEVPKPERMLSVDDKETLAREGTEFIVTSIQMGDDKQFGPFWEVRALLGDEPVTFRMSQHARRDAFVQAVAAATASGPISGLKLAAYPGQGGNAFINLEPA